MSFRINTNITAMNAYANANANQADLEKSLSKLSSGLQIESAADNASGMTIADSLRAQANALGQSIKNANDASGIVETADNAMDEQINILDTIKTKATQAAQDGQNTNSRKALQSDISKLLEELDNIANTTSFNGQSLLNGSFTNKNFQIGAYSNQTVAVSIGATQSDKIGLTRFETSANMAYNQASVTDALAFNMKFNNVDGYPNGYSMASVTGKEVKADGLNAFAEKINAVSDTTGIRARVTNSITFTAAVAAGDIKGLKINGVTIGNISVKANDDNGVLVNAINAVKEQTGVEASVDASTGKLTLTNASGGKILINAAISATGAASSTARFMGINTKAGESIGTTAAKGGLLQLGKLTLIRQDARDIEISIGGTGAAVAGTHAVGSTTAGVTSISATMLQAVSLKSAGLAQESISLADLNTGVMSSTIANAIGYFATGLKAEDQLSGVTTYAGAQAMIDVAESAQKQLDKIRSNLGSVENQLTSTINNITTTQVNVKAAESQIRDVDFASEASNFNKYNILAQAGSYAMAQANTVQKNVTQLLQ
jgi:flagellin